jgi:hypothetical protein
MIPNMLLCCFAWKLSKEHPVAVYDSKHAALLLCVKNQAKDILLRYMHSLFPGSYALQPLQLP